MDIGRRFRLGQAPVVWLSLAGLLEVGLFGLPLVLAGRYIATFVRAWDPHIYHEYGVARIWIGMLFMYAGRRGRDDHRVLVARAGAAFYLLNIVVSLYDLAVGNVARVEWAVVGLSAVLAVALGRAWLGVPAGGVDGA